MKANDLISRKRWAFTVARALVLAGVFTLGGPAGAADKQVTVKLGTLMPRGTSYHKSLLAMKEKWRQAPGGGVNLIIYPDGTQGGEADMVGLMRSGNLDAGFLSAVGLSEIEPGVAGLQSMPMMFRSLEEVDYIGEKLRPRLEKRLEEKGFVVLFWADSGWVRFFSKDPVITPEDSRKVKLFVWRGDNAQTDIYREAGFNPVPLETADIAPMLGTGMVNALFMPPFFAVASQLEKRTPHMLELNYAPLVGASVIRKKTWDKIPPATQAELLKAAEASGKDIKARGRAESTESVEAMKSKGGLVVHKVTPEIEELWRKASEKVYPSIRGKMVPADIFDEVQRLLQAYRAGKGVPSR